MQFHHSPKAQDLIDEITLSSDYNKSTKRESEYLMEFLLDEKKRNAA